MISLALQISVLAIRLYGAYLFKNYALLFESFHVLTDITVTGAVFAGIKIANSKSGMKYSYGLYRIEDLISLAIAVLIVYTALDLLISLPSSRPMSDLQSSLVEFISLAPLFGSGIVKIRGGRTIHSTSLVSDGIHNYSDVYVGLGVGIGLFLSYITASSYFYYGAVIIAAVAILYTSYSVGKDSITGIMDLPKDKKMIPKIKEIVSENKDVWEIKSIRARWAGAVVFVELVIAVNSRLRIEEAHDVATSIEESLTSRISDIKDVVVHIEPSVSNIHVILVPINDKEEVSDVFARSTRYELFKYVGKELKFSKSIEVSEREVPSEKNAIRVLEIAKDNGVTDVITLNAGQIVRSLFEVNHIYLWRATSRSVEENVSLLLQNQLQRITI
ncbi:MAG: cation diffusion facilitator family transporter [Thermoplasmatales archaeon]